MDRSSNSGLEYARQALEDVGSMLEAIAVLMHRCDALLQSVRLQLQLGSSLQALRLEVNKATKLYGLSMELGGVLTSIIDDARGEVSRALAVLAPPERAKSQEAAGLATVGRSLDATAQAVGQILSTTTAKMESLRTAIDQDHVTPDVVDLVETLLVNLRQAGRQSK